VYDLAFIFHPDFVLFNEKIEQDKKRQMCAGPNKKHAPVWKIIYRHNFLFS
jgi:hypothetical protein